MIMRVTSIIGAALVAVLCAVGVAPAAEDMPVGRVEVVLANEHRARLGEIKQEFVAAGLANVHIQIMKAGKPPVNLGLGPKVTVDRAQAAIRLARKYNGGVTILLPERLFADHYVAIASSGFDDTVEYPVSEEQLKQLEAPSLTTEQFHELYRRFTPADHPPMKKGRVF